MLVPWPKHSKFSDQQHGMPEDLVQVGEWVADLQALLPDQTIQPTTCSLLPAPRCLVTQIRPSMRKFESTHNAIEVCQVSRGCIMAWCMPSCSATYIAGYLKLSAHWPQDRVHFIMS
jgi:hypothetical protein